MYFSICMNSNTKRCELLFTIVESSFLQHDHTLKITPTSNDQNATWPTVQQLQHHASLPLVTLISPLVGSFFMVVEIPSNYSTSTTTFTNVPCTNTFVCNFRYGWIVLAPMIGLVQQPLRCPLVILHQRPFRRPPCPSRAQSTRNTIAWDPM